MKFDLKLLFQTLHSKHFFNIRYAPACLVEWKLHISPFAINMTRVYIEPS